MFAKISMMCVLLCVVFLSGCGKTAPDPHQQFIVAARSANSNYKAMSDAKVLHEGQIVCAQIKENGIATFLNALGQMIDQIDVGVIKMVPVSVAYLCPQYQPELNRWLQANK